MWCMLARYLNTQDKHTRNHPDMLHKQKPASKRVTVTLACNCRESNRMGQEENQARKEQILHGERITRAQRQVEHLWGRVGKRGGATNDGEEEMCTPSNSGTAYLRNGVPDSKVIKERRTSGTNRRGGYPGDPYCIPWKIRRRLGAAPKRVSSSPPGPWLGRPLLF